MILKQHISWQSTPIHQAGLSGISSLPKPGYWSIRFPPERVTSTTLLPAQHSDSPTVRLCIATCSDTIPHLSVFFLALDKIWLLVHIRSTTELIIPFVYYCQSSSFFLSLSLSAILALAPAISPRTKRCTLFRDLHSAQHSSTMRVGGNFPRSDVLCVEFDQGSNGRTAMFGHRNGAVSIVDRRCTLAKQLTNENANEGSVSSILCPTLSNGRTVLVKKSFGSCFLYDVRKMGKHSQVHSMVGPDLHSSTTLSACCSGVALDPTESVVISPYLSMNNTVSLGLWSLRTGLCMATKKPTMDAYVEPSKSNAININSTTTSHTVVQPKPRSNRAGSLPHCELNRNITPSWNLVDGGMPSKDNERKSNATTKLERDRHRWSLWWKTESVPIPNHGDGQIPNCIGTIHQLSFEGSVLPTDQRAE